MPSIPLKPHQGAFGTVRRYDVHTGIDLYCQANDEVFAVEDGVVLANKPFTGSLADSPWWHDTNYVAVKGESGIVVYGEISSLLKEGDKIKAGEVIGKVLTVLKNDKGLPMNMLHLELYSSFDEPLWWKKDENQPENLLDPTSNLLNLED